MLIKFWRNREVPAECYGSCCLWVFEGSHDETVSVLKKETFVVSAQNATSSSSNKEESPKKGQSLDMQESYLYSVRIERGFDFRAANEMLTSSTSQYSSSTSHTSSSNDGFYVLRHGGSSRRTPFLALRNEAAERQQQQQQRIRTAPMQLFHLYTPNSGLKSKTIPLDELTSKYKKVLESS